MNAITRWDPFKELDELNKRLSMMYGRAPVRKDSEKEEAMTVAEWAPLVDILEEDKEYLIKAELPEVKREDVKVTVEEGVLTVSGERKFEKEEKGKKYHRVERAYGRYARSFTLPQELDEAKAEAKFRDGVLELTLPKKAAAARKAIAIQ